MKRRVRIILEPRSASDSEAILNNISKVFTNDDIDILLHCEELTKNREAKEEDLSNTIVDSINSNLEKQNSSLPAGKEVEEKTETKQAKKWVQNLTYEGIKTFVTTIIKGAIDLLL